MHNHTLQMDIIISQHSLVYRARGLSQNVTLCTSNLFDLVSSGKGTSTSVVRRNRLLPSSFHFVSSLAQCRFARIR